MSRAVHRMLSPLLILVTLTSGITCHANEPTLSASSYVLIHADSGRVLLARNETDELPIASTTKIMTALVALRHSRLTDSVTVKREHLKEGSSMYLAEGETLTMEALLYGLMLPSGNDAAECIADNCGGRERFVRLMNETAAELGMTHTSFANPSGLDETGHYSCALDMARLMAAAMDEPAFLRIVSTRTASVETRVMTNHNKLLSAVKECNGGKTGYTGAAGRTLVTCAERDAMRLIAVTLHDGNDWADHTALYDYGFSGCRMERAIEHGKPCALSAVRGGETACVPLIPDRGFSYPLTDGETLALRYELPEAVQAPVKAGQRLGEAVAYVDGKEVGRVALRAANDVKAAENKSPRLFLWRR